LAAVGVVFGGGDVASHYGDGRNEGSWYSLVFYHVDWRKLTAELRGTVALLVLQGVRGVGSELSSRDILCCGILDEREFLLVGRVEVAGEFLAVRALATVRLAASLNLTLFPASVVGTVAGASGSANWTVKAVVVAESASGIVVVRRLNGIG
jgi:hypothetical protein